MENTEEIYTDFARVYDELMDNTPYDMWCDRLDELITACGVSKPTRDAEGILDSAKSGGGLRVRNRYTDGTVV